MLTGGPDWLRRLALAVSSDGAAHPLKAGLLSELQPFQMSGPNHSASAGNDAERTTGAAPSSSPAVSFIAPICLENIDPAIIRQMIWRPATPGKRADFIANLSNDGVFSDQERY